MVTRRIVLTYRDSWCAMQDGAYIVKLLDLFDLCELGDEPAVLHKFFDIFYALGNVSLSRRPIVAWVMWLLDQSSHG